MQPLVGRVWPGVLRVGNIAWPAPHAHSCRTQPGPHLHRRHDRRGAGLVAVTKTMGHVPARAVTAGTAGQLVAGTDTDMVAAVGHSRRTAALDHHTLPGPNTLAAPSCRHARRPAEPNWA